MATKTLGTNATSSLTAVAFSGGTDLAPADIATIQQAILDDLTNGSPIYPGAFAQNGLLYIPSRGVLRVLPGDWVGVDNKGWPILVSKNSIANAAWTHT